MIGLKIPFPGRRRLGRKAIAAVEFALCAPVLLVVFLGTVEILMLYRTATKLNQMTSDFAQMVSLQEQAAVDPNTGLTNTHSPVPTGTPGITDLCKGAVYGLQPFPPLGLTLNVASLTQITSPVAGPPAVPATYDSWEVDLDSNCNTTGTENIGTTGPNGVVTKGVGNGGTTGMVQGPGDNIIIVTASLQYPGVLGIILTTAQTLKQTAVARWRYASKTNISTVVQAPPPSATLQFICTGTGCVTHSCSSSSSCT